MAATGIGIFTATSSPAFQLAARNLKSNPISVPARRSAIHTKRAGTTITCVSEKDVVDADVSEAGRASLKDYFEQSKELIKSDGGPPRWFSPLDCGSRSKNSPLLLFLPGVDGVGLGLILHHQKLGKIFDIWCLHIPVMDRTTFTDLVKLVERVIRSENYCSPNRPIYLVGESLGGCIALDVAACNPDIDLVLILANPAVCLSKSLLQPLIHLLEVMPDQLYLSLPNTLSLMGGDPLRIAMTSVEKILPLQQTVGELSQGLVAVSSYLSVLADILPKETLLWKLKMFKSASAVVNSRLYDVEAQMLILSSGRDQFLPSLEEGERLYCAMKKCELRKFDENGHFLFLEDGFDLVTTLKGTSFYRCAKYHDYVSDYMLPTPSEIKQTSETYSLIDWLTSPVMLSTLENGKVVKGLSGIPLEGPVLLVGYHMLLGWELFPLVFRIFTERNIIVRGMAHPLIFGMSEDVYFSSMSTTHDAYRLWGAVPVSATNFYKLFSSKSHILLYPGGMREALHQKGEEYKLFWPEQAEFVRMAARFGAKIIPFGSVGEDDVGEVVLDYDDLMKIPFLKTYLEKLADKNVRLRTDINGEVANQHIHIPGILPRLPGRFYFFFGKPIETEGRKHELMDRKKCHEVYLQVKSEVETCIAYLKEKREKDPYRSILSRALYQAMQGSTSEIPTFEP